MPATSRGYGRTTAASTSWFRLSGVGGFAGSCLIWPAARNQPQTVQPTMYSSASSVTRRWIVASWTSPNSVIRSVAPVSATWASAFSNTRRSPWSLQISAGSGACG